MRARSPGRRLRRRTGRGGHERRGAVAPSRRVRRCHVRTGLSVREDWILDGRFSFAGGADAGAVLFAGGVRPTAVFCASDEMALGVMLAARRAGLSVPGEVSVMGIDGHEYGEVVGLTTVAQDPVAQGRAAARAVLAEVDGGVTEPLPASPAHLVERSTTAPPP
ncbi:substrate-binding domain-containing protein [Curtobacterium flaccumfaciens]|nr:substrate-binding domain-containing protein [Curtobacterium flaccumfaciens]